MTTTTATTRLTPSEAKTELAALEDAQIAYGEARADIADTPAATQWDREHGIVSFPWFSQA